MEAMEQPESAEDLRAAYRADTARLSYDLLNATLDAFKENASTDRVNQASLAISFYQSQLQDAQDHLNKLTSSARQYIASNPDLLVGFGDDQTLGLNHWLQHGYVEGRSTTRTASARGRRYRLRI